MKNVLSGFVALVLLLSITLPAMATAESQPLLRITSTPDYAETSWTLTTDSGEFAISNASCVIEKVSSTSVHASASTQTNETAETIGGTIYLQKWVNSAWSTINSQSFSASNTDTSTGSANWTVQSGYYYRLRTSHTATKDGINVSRTTYSSSILVN